MQRGQEKTLPQYGVHKNFSELRAVRFPARVLLLQVAYGNCDYSVLLQVVMGQV